MKICFAVSAPEGLASHVDAIRPDLRYLLVFDQETRSAVEIDLSSPTVQGDAANDFDALVCASLTRPLFRALRQQGKAVYLTQAASVEAAVAEFERGEMMLIPDEAAGGCSGGGCGGHGHEHEHGHGHGGCQGGCHGHGEATDSAHAHTHGGCQCGSSAAGGEGGCHGAGGGCGHDHGHGHEHGHGHGHSAGGCCASRHAAGQAQPRVRGEHLRVAVTSQNRKTVTEHAGKCRKFWVYETRGGQVTDKTLLELPLEQSLHASPDGQAHPLDGVDVLITAGIGDGLRQRLFAKGIETVVSSEPNPDAAVEALFAAS